MYVCVKLLPILTQVPCSLQRNDTHIKVDVLVLARTRLEDWHAYSYVHTYLWQELVFTCGLLPMHMQNCPL